MSRSVIVSVYCMQERDSANFFLIKLTPELYDHGVMIYECRNITIGRNKKYKSTH